MAFNPRAFAFFILALASLGIAGYLFNNESSLSSDFFSISLPTGWFVNQNKDYIKADINLNGTFSDNLYIKLEDQTLELTLPSSSQVVIDESKVSYFNPLTLTLKDFSGNIKLTPYKIEINGEVSTIVNDVEAMSHTKDKILFSYNGSYDSILIKSLPPQDLMINRFMGKIDALIKGDHLLYEVSNKNIEIRDYEGYFAILQGRIELRGTGLIRSDVLEVYARE